MPQIFQYLNPIYLEKSTSEKPPTAICQNSLLSTYRAINANFWRRIKITYWAKYEASWQRLNFQFSLRIFKKKADLVSIKFVQMILKFGSSSFNLSELVTFQLIAQSMPASGAEAKQRRATKNKVCKNRWQRELALESKFNEFRKSLGLRITGSRSTCDGDSSRESEEILRKQRSADARWNIKSEEVSFDLLSSTQRRRRGTVLCVFRATLRSY